MIKEKGKTSQIVPEREQLELFRSAEEKLQATFCAIICLEFLIFKSNRIEVSHELTENQKSDLLD